MFTKNVISGLVHWAKYIEASMAFKCDTLCLSTCSSSPQYENDPFQDQEIKLLLDCSMGELYSY